MWIEKRITQKGIKYKYIERYINPLTQKECKVSVTLGQATAQAKKQAFILLQEKINNKTNEIKPTLLTFEEVAKEWFESNAKVTKPSTINGNRIMMNRIISMLPNGILLHRLTTQIVQKLLNTLYHDENKTYGYTRKFYILIKQIYKYAYRIGYIQDIQFLDRVELRKKPFTQDEILKIKNKFLSQDELKAVLLQLNNLHPRLSKAMEFIALTGLRFGELTALRYCDWLNNEIDVNGTIVTCATKSDSICRGTPKNIYSHRIVPINDRAKYILEWFKNDNNRLKLWGNSYNDRGYIFTSNNGNPINLQYANRVLRKIQIEGKRISTHIFRHTHISMLSDMNVPIKAIMERVGHNDPRTTLAIYTHVSEQSKQQIINKLNNIKIV